MKKTYHIQGMHCRSCELQIEKGIKNIAGVSKARASTSKGLLTVISENDVSNEVAKRVEAAGYKLTDEGGPWINRDKNIYFQLFVSFVIVIFLLVILQLFNFQGLSSPELLISFNLFAVLVLGLTAGFSSCMAVVGGLVLGISARFSELHPEKTTIQKFYPHLFFNGGRIISFFVFGGILGSLGSIFHLSGTALGILMILVAVVMFFLGLQLTEVFPKLTAITLPKFIISSNPKKDKEYSNLRASTLGAFTFFLPCGFTQAVQLFAISTGSFTKGALVMAFFALGTTPGLLAIGGSTSLVKNGVYSKIFLKTIGVIIIILSISNFQNGLNLTGVKALGYEDLVKGSESEGENNESKGDVTLIKAVYDPDLGSQYVIEPKDFTVKVNSPVRLEIYAKEDGQGCMGSVMLPGLVPRSQAFSKDKTAVFEFTPKKQRDYLITCGMGIPMGTIKVVN